MVCELRGYTANFHVGFDETTLLLRARYSDLSLDVMYCYDLAKHTEPSIQTARAVQAPMEGTKPIVTNHLGSPPTTTTSLFSISPCTRFETPPSVNFAYDSLESPLFPRDGSS